MHKKWAIYHPLYILFWQILNVFGQYWWPKIGLFHTFFCSILGYIYHNPFHALKLILSTNFFKKILGGFYQTSSHTKESILLLFNARKAVSMNVENHDDHGKCSCHFFQVARQGLFGVSHEKCFNIHK